MGHRETTRKGGGGGGKNSNEQRKKGIRKGAKEGKKMNEKTRKITCQTAGKKPSRKPLKQRRRGLLGKEEKDGYEEVRPGESGSRGRERKMGKKPHLRKEIDRTRIRVESGKTEIHNNYKGEQPTGKEEERRFWGVTICFSIWKEEQRLFFGGVVRYR